MIVQILIMIIIIGYNNVLLYVGITFLRCTKIMSIL